MREIKFKAKRKDNNEYVYGYFIKNSTKSYILSIFEDISFNFFV